MKGVYTNKMYVMLGMPSHAPVIKYFWNYYTV